MQGGLHPMVSIQHIGTDALLRFAFRPEDTDLTRTAGWAVLMMNIGDELHQLSTQCTEVQVGSVLVVKSMTPLQLTGPTMNTRQIPSVGGEVVVTGLDGAGLYTLSDGARSLSMVVRGSRSPSTQLNEQTELGSGIYGAHPLSLNSTFWGIALTALLLLLIVGRKRKWYVGALTILIVTPLATGTFGGQNPPISMFLDVSPSMAIGDGKLPSSVRALSDEHTSLRADFSEVLVKVGPSGAKPGRSDRAVSLFQSFNDLHETALAEHDLLLVTDGRLDSVEVSWHRPVYVYLHESQGVDVRLAEAEAIEMQDGVYIQALVESTGPAVGGCECEMVNRSFGSRRLEFNR